MKITILKENLKKGLNVVERIVGKNLTLPILNNIFLKAEKNFLNLTSTNLEVGVKYWVLSKVEKEGSILAPSKIFSSFINNISEDKVSLILKDKNIHFGSSKTFIKGLETNDYPIIPEIETKEFIEVKASEFCSALSVVFNFTAQNQSRRPEISGVYINITKDRINLVATDSYRLGEKSIVIKNTIDDLSFIIPQKTAGEIINIFSEEDIIRIYHSPSQVLFESMLKEVNHPKIQLSSTLIQGEYPNYKDIIPTNFKTKLIVDKDDFIAKIKRASIFSNKSNEIKFNIDQKGINIYSQNTDIGEDESFIPAEVDGEDSEVCFNYKFILDGLSNIKTKKISFDMNGNSGPSIIKPIGESGYVYLLMPIKE